MGIFNDIPPGGNLSPRRALKLCFGVLIIAGALCGATFGLVGCWVESGLLGALLLGFSNCALCVADAVLETDGVMSVAGRPVFTPIVVVVILVVSMLIFTSVMFCVS